MRRVITARALRRHSVDRGRQVGLAIIEWILIFALAGVIAVIITAQVVDTGSLKMPTLG